MDLIKRTWEQMLAIFKDMKTSQKVTFGTAVGLVLISLSFLVIKPSDKKYEFFAVQDEFDADEYKELKQTAAEAGIKLMREGTSIKVSTGQGDELLALHASKGGNMKFLQNFAWLDPAKKSMLSTPTPTERAINYRLSTTLRLQDILEHWEKIKKASLNIVAKTNNPLEPYLNAKASVDIESTGFGWSKKDTESVIHFISSAWQGLEPENVKLMVDGDYQEYDNDPNTRLATKADEMKRARERNLEIRIRKFIEDSYRVKPNVMVNLVQSANLQTNSRETIMEEPISSTVEQTENKEQTTGATQPELGVVAETENQRSSQGGIDSLRENKTKINETVGVGRQKTTTSGEAAFQEVSRSVIISLPEEGLLLPTDTELLAGKSKQQILASRTEKLTNFLVKMDFPEDKIEVGFVPRAALPTPHQATFAEQLLGVLHANMNQIILGILTLVVFATTFGFIKKSIPKPVVVQVGELEEETMDRKEQERLAELEEQIALEEPPTDTRAQLVEEKVKGIIRDNPEDAASLVQRWLLER